MAISQFFTRRDPPVRIPDGDAASVDAGGAQLRVHDREGVIVISIDGDVDSFNVDRVDEYARAFLRAGRPMVLDLSQTIFFCARGGGFLIEFDEKCREAGLVWALVMSQSVERVIRILEAEVALPVSISLVHALGTIKNRPVPSL